MDFQNDDRPLQLRSLQVDEIEKKRKKTVPWIPQIKEAKQSSNAAFEAMQKSLVNVRLDGIVMHGEFCRGSLTKAPFWIEFGVYCEACTDS